MCTCREFAGCGLAGFFGALENPPELLARFLDVVVRRRYLTPGDVDSDTSQSDELFRPPLHAGKVLSRRCDALGAKVATGTRMGVHLRQRAQIG